ncbi:tripartite motif-containing protein 16-like isoform X2 [Thalassophryne amazonica]|uniref:tripartite motif-containing protein 16-like isoform X2 n=1 Tax=Thalassophryne amazonica TaxID=390379 RepID=UPI00147115E6|nr:tripartite motif-containing protein 16-like isoform X2 [Thalassophryne amazonica]
MAQGGIQLDQEALCCSICLDLLKDPVTIPCGHSYCMNCIRNLWDRHYQTRTHSCPQCRQTFTVRPVLVKNTMLAHLVEELKNIGLQAAPVDHCYAGPEDVSCDLCTGRKLKAFKSCLVCLVSYCEKHLQPHYDVAPLKKHKLVEPLKNLQQNICSHHNEVMKMFCRTDQQCICYLCSVDEHKGHDTVSAAAQRTKRQREVEVRRQQIQERIQIRGEEVKVVQRDVDPISHSADKAVGDSEKMFTGLIQLIDKRSDVKQQIRSQQKIETSRVQDLQEKLEQEISDLRRKEAELHQLSQSEDHNQFLQKYPSLTCLPEDADSPRIQTRPLRYFEDVTAAVSKVKVKLQDIVSEEQMQISRAQTEVDVLLPEAEPKLRTDFFKYSCEITLDPNTAKKYLILSEGNRKIKPVEQKQCYSDHPGRFNDWWQVLSRESLSGRCYWEVEWNGKGVSVAVTYKNIKRTGSKRQCVFGNNQISWALHYYGSGYYFRNKRIQTPVSGRLSSRLGVYLDHSAGLLSFYSVSKTMTLLHRVQTTFTQPLHVGLAVHNFGDTAEICELK